jgi:hypothetical protein
MRVGAGTVDICALESKVMLLVQKMEGYKKEVGKLRMRQERMEGYVRRIEEIMEKEVKRCCSDAENGEILLYLFSLSSYKLYSFWCSVARGSPSLSSSGTNKSSNEMVLPSSSSIISTEPQINPNYKDSTSPVEDGFSTPDDLDMPVSGPQDGGMDYTGYVGIQQPSLQPMSSIGSPHWQQRYQDASMEYGNFMATPKAAVLGSSSSGLKMSLSMPSSSQIGLRLTRSMSCGSGTESGSATACRTEKTMQGPRPPLPVLNSSGSIASSGSSSSIVSTGSNMSPSTSSSSGVNVNMKIGTSPVSSLSVFSLTGAGGTQQLPLPNFKTALGVGLPASISSSDTSILNTMERPPHILLAENDEVAKTLCCKFLEKCGCEFDAVKDGIEAVNQMMLRCYDLVLMVSISLVHKYCNCPSASYFCSPPALPPLLVLLQCELTCVWRVCRT